jgi:hypothetical protein
MWAYGWSVRLARGGDAARFSADARLQAGSGEREQADFGLVQHDECIVVVRSHKTLRQVDVNFAVLCWRTGPAERDSGDATSPIVY